MVVEKRDLLGFEDLYYATSDGHIIAKEEWLLNRYNTKAYNELRKYTNEVVPTDLSGINNKSLDNNIKIYLYNKDKKVKQYYDMNKLILSTFQPIEDVECFHARNKNGIKTDLNVENLEWIAPKKYQYEDGSFILIFTHNAPIDAITINEFPFYYVIGKDVYSYDKFIFNKNSSCKYVFRKSVKIVPYENDTGNKFITFSTSVNDYSSRISFEKIISNPGTRIKRNSYSRYTELTNKLDTKIISGKDAVRVIDKGEKSNKRYYVTLDGSVYSINRLMQIEKVIPYHNNKKLTINVGDRVYSVNRLILDAFGPKVDDITKYKAINIDGDYNNNNISNLKWELRDTKSSYKKTINEKIYIEYNNELDKYYQIDFGNGYFYVNIKGQVVLKRNKNIIKMKPNHVSKKGPVYVLSDYVNDKKMSALYTAGNLVIDTFKSDNNLDNYTFSHIDGNVNNNHLDNLDIHIMSKDLNNVTNLVVKPIKLNSDAIIVTDDDLHKGGNPKVTPIRKNDFTVVKANIDFDGDIILWGETKLIPENNSLGFRINIERKDSKSKDYYITNDGSIFSHNLTKDTFKKLKPYNTKSGGYVYLSKGVNWSYTRLYLTAFKPILNCNNDSIVILDGNRENTSLDNLEWLSVFEDENYVATESSSSELDVFDVEVDTEKLKFENILNKPKLGKKINSDDVNDTIIKLEELIKDKQESTNDIKNTDDSEIVYIKLDSATEVSDVINNVSTNEGNDELKLDSSFKTFGNFHTYGKHNKLVSSFKTFGIFHTYEKHKSVPKLNKRRV